MCACVSVCVTYSRWVAGGLRVLDIYANHFVVLVVIKDQDVQAGLALAARVSNQIWFGCNMWTVNRSCDPTLRGSARNAHIFQLVIINFVLIAFAFEHLASGVPGG